MTQITFSNSGNFLKMLFELRSQGVACSGASDDSGFYYIDIPKE